jgi:hypothetical protein
MEAMLKMVNLDIAELLRAFDSVPSQGRWGVQWV